MQPMTDWWQTNLEALAQNSPHLFEQVQRHRPTPIGRLVQTATGHTNLLYDTGDTAGLSAYHHDSPWQDAEGHLAVVTPNSYGLVVFVGIGLGYGPLYILRQRPTIPQMVLLEPSLDLFCMALHALDLRPLITSGKVQFFVGDVDMAHFEGTVARMAALEDTHILRHPPSFLWNNALYASLNDRVYMLLNQLNAGGGTTRKCGRLFFQNRYDNLSLLRHSHRLDLLANICQGRPAILVAAGPSLDRNLPELKAAQGRCVLIAADSALAPLLQAGITPDFVTSIDYLDLNFEKLTPFLDREWSFSLVAMIKATPLVPKRFPARHLFLSFVEDRPHDWIVEALGVKALVPSCSSVAHLSLGLALTMGADPIIFVGQDLSFTSRTGDHASGTIIMRQDIPQDREIFHVAAIGGGTVATDRQLLSLKKHFEDIIAATPRTYINASAAGVMIDGTTAIPLAAAIDHHLKEDSCDAVTALIDQAITAGPPTPVSTFIEACRRNVQRIDRTQGDLATVLAIAQQAKRQVDELRRHGRAILAFRDLPPALTRQLVQFDKVNATLDSDDSFWIQVLELTFETLSENDRWRDRNQQVREREGYLPWLLAEIERIDAVNRCRAEALTTYRQRLATLSQHLEQEQSLQRELAADNKTNDACRKLVRHHLLSGDLRAIRPLLARLLAPGQTDPEALILAGEVSAGMLDYSDANRYWALALERDSGLQPRLAGIRQHHANEWLGVAERYANANEGGDNFPHLLPVWLSRVLALTDRSQQLPTGLTTLWQRHAARLETWFVAEDWQAALLTLDGWKVAADLLPAIHFYRARYAAARHDHLGALAAIDAALAITPDNPQWLVFAARELLALDRFAEGIARLQGAVALDPSTASLWEEIGDRLSREGDLSGAIMAFERCYLAMPHHAEALYKMGNCYLVAKQTEAAIAAYDAVLAKDPGHEAARLGLARARGLAG